MAKAGYTCHLPKKKENVKCKICSITAYFSLQPSNAVSELAGIPLTKTFGFIN